MSKLRQSCCIKGCDNKPSTTRQLKPLVAYYSIPNPGLHAPWREKKRNLWIEAIRKHSKHSENWEPPIGVKVCSMHFVNNRKAEHPHDPSYLPSIFPGTGEWKKVLESFIRQEDNANNENTVDNKNLSADEDNEEYMITEAIDEEPMIIAKNLFNDVACQTDIENEFKNANPGISFSCIMNQENGLSTAQIQVDIVREFQGFQGISSIKNDNELSNLTGISLSSFNYLLKLLPDDETIKLCKRNKLLLTLMVLKTGIDFLALEIFFNIHHNSASQIFTSVLNCLYKTLKKSISWPSAETVESSLPDIFKKHYPKTRVITECVKIKLPLPNDCKDEILTLPQYKMKRTVKYLIGCTPSGLITFVSKSYGGMIDDLFITKDSGILDLLEPGDVVMTKRGSPTIRKDVRNHIEKLTQRFRDFSTFTSIPNVLLPHKDQIIHVTCALMNLKPTII